MSLAQTMVIGIGSSHGDDQIGWKVIDELASREIGGLTLKKLATPFELIDEIDRANEVHIVDAVTCASEKVTRARYGDHQNNAVFAETKNQGTHDFGLLRSLELAESLGKPTDHITLWLGTGETFEPLTAMSKQATDSISECVSKILREIADA